MTDVRDIQRLVQDMTRRHGGPIGVHVRSSAAALPNGPNRSSSISRSSSTPAAAHEVPSGYRLGTTADVGARVAVQRSAFAGSTMTDEKYERVRGTWPHREELDVVVEHADEYTAFALGWLDDANGIVELEPVGTHADHGRRGLACAAILEALRRARLVGAHTATVSARGDDAYPAPLRLYRSLGFEPYGTHHEYVRTP